jgi:8-oxo-dGTP pyrophosphatase MutT (NUDIX family)
MKPTEEEIVARLQQAMPSANTDGYVEVEAPVGTLKCAAVLVPLLRVEGEWRLLYTRRTDRVESHKSQVSFPGGACDEGETTPEQTALREAEEEVGIAAFQVEILGRLPEYRTGTGFVITPVVGLVTPPLNLKLDDFEVAEVFEPPLEFLLDSANHQRQSIEVRGARHEYWAMPWQGHFIWGATAGMLVSLREALLGIVSSSDG